MAIPRKHGRAEVVPAVMLPEVVFDAGEGKPEPAGGTAEAVKAAQLPEAVFDCQNPADGGSSLRTWRKRLFVLAVVILVGGVALYWLLPDRLTDEERQLVGRWSRTVAVKSPDDTVQVLELNDDRSCRIALFDPVTRQPLQNALEGRWSVRSGELVLDYETRSLNRLSRSVPGLRGHVHALRRESLTVESVEPAALRLRTPGRPPVDPPETQVYTRATDRLEIPASFDPQDLPGGR